jgi:hypothetical protein
MPEEAGSISPFSKSDKMSSCLIEPLHHSLDLDLWGCGTEVLMTKHRTITGFVGVALLAIVATAATMRPHWPLTSPSGSFGGIPSFNERWADANKLLTEKLDDQALLLVERARALNEKGDHQSR